MFILLKIWFFDFNRHIQPKLKSTWIRETTKEAFISLIHGETQTEVFEQQVIPTGTTSINLRVVDNEGAQSSITKLLNLQNGQIAPYFSIDWDVSENYLVTLKVTDENFSILPETKFEWEVNGTPLGELNSQAINYQS